MSGNCPVRACSIDGFPKRKRNTHPVMGRALWVPTLDVGLEGRGHSASKSVLDGFEGAVRGGN